MDINYGEARESTSKAVKEEWHIGHPSKGVAESQRDDHCCW
jgi:hypothetical protein